jgi:hypothetical protein
VIAFQIETSLESMEQLLDRYIQTGEVAGPLVPQLSNGLKQAKHHLDKGDPDKAAKHMERMLKPLNHPVIGDDVSDAAKAALTTDANALIQVWMSMVE